MMRLFFPMELSEFLQENIKFPTLPEDYWKNVDLDEEIYFNAQLSKYPLEKQQNIKEKLEYIRNYTKKYPDFDGFNWGISNKPMLYYEVRDKKIANCNLSEEDYNNFDILQDSIKELGISPQATFEFIVFLWDVLQHWLLDGKVQFLKKKIKNVFKRIEEKPEDKIEIDLKVGKKHYYFKDENFIKSILANFLNSDLYAHNSWETIYPTKREVDYILIKTLLENLPINQKKEKKGNYSQAERNFSLCVLWLTGGINHKKNDDPYLYCTKENNVTFDKLMRDFKDLKLPPVLPSII